MEAKPRPRIRLFQRMAPRATPLQDAAPCEPLVRKSLNGLTGVLAIAVCVSACSVTGHRAMTANETATPNPYEMVGMIQNGVANGCKGNGSPCLTVAFQPYSAGATPLQNFTIAQGLQYVVTDITSVCNDAISAYPNSTGSFSLIGYNGQPAISVYFSVDGKGSGRFSEHFTTPILIADGTKAEPVTGTYGSVDGVLPPPSGPVQTPSGPPPQWSSAACSVYLQGYLIQTSSTPPSSPPPMLPPIVHLPWPVLPGHHPLPPVHITTALPEAG